VRYQPNRLNNAMKYIKQLGKKQLVLGSLLLILAVIPLTLFMAQQNQEQRSRATAATQLYLVPSTTASIPLQKNIGDSVSFDVMINPGTNLPSVVKLVLQYDPTKFQASATPFAVNAAAFPSTLEGPISQSGLVVASVSIGSDTTKAIQTITKVGTLTLTAISPTTSGATIISFGTNSQVLSVAKTDQSNENVLSTTTPAYISIASPITPTTVLTLAPTATPTPLPTANPTAVLTAIPTTIPTNTLSPSQPVTPSVEVSPTPAPSPIPTATPVPTQIPLPTPTLAPATTYLTLTTFLHGIGNSGDNANPNTSTLSNKTPIRQQRNITAYVYNDQNQLTDTQAGTVTYDPANGNYSGSVNFANTLADGYYTVLVKEDTHLRKSVPGILHIIPQQNNILPSVTLVAGDINNDNVINILDYNILIGCYSDLLPAVSCTDNQKVISDLNDDASVNQVDYNLFLREVTVQNGN
jgi:hypothetical protein